MKKFDNLSAVIALAELAHRDQVDKAGLPYIEHPRRVMQTVQAQGALPFVQMAAILHDVIEDTPFTEDVLLQLGVPKPVVDLVVLLTRTPGQQSDDYYFPIRDNDHARIIKLADIQDNTQEWRLSYLDEKTQTRLKHKYFHARRKLERVYG